MIIGNDIITKAKKYLGCKGLQFCKAYGYSKTVDWCVIFIWYVFKDCKASKLLCDGSKVQNVGVLNDWLKANCKKVSIKNAKAGDIVIQSWDGYEQAHAGLVVKSLGLNSLQTIEGNPGYEANTKTIVKLSTRYSGNIYAIYRPNYDTKSSGTEKKKDDLNTMVKDVLLGKYGNGADRKKKLGINYDKVQNEVNRIVKLVNDTLSGKYGNGTVRKKKLGADYDIVQWYINIIVEVRKE